MPRKTGKNNTSSVPTRTRAYLSRTAKNKKSATPELLIHPPAIPEEVESIKISNNPKISTTGTPPPIQKIESPKEIKEIIQNAVINAKDINIMNKYKVNFTEKHRQFFLESRDRIFSGRTPFETAIVRFNVSFASELKLYNPKTKKEFDEFISKTPERVLSVPEGGCEVIVCGTWGGSKDQEKIIHAGMVYNKKGKYMIFNPNDDDKCYDDGFYYCYTSDNAAFDRPLRGRKQDLHFGIKSGACFVISYALKILCEKMKYAEFIKLVKTKTLREIMEKCFEVMEN